MNTIPESVSPAGLRMRAAVMRERGDESTARHIELAADALAEMPRKKGNPLTDPARQITTYQAQLNFDTGEMTLIFAKKDENKRSERVIGYLTFPRDEVYEFGQYVFAQYDRLEGIADAAG